MRRVQLTRGKRAMVDNDDYDRVITYPWQARPSFGTWYAQRSFANPGGGRATVNMARWIMGVTDPNLVVDHRNGNGLDNRRANLRIARWHENSQNTLRPKREGSSRFKGVSWHGAAQKWQARISVRSERIDLGRFDDEREAYAAYVAASRLYHREFSAPRYL